MEISFFSHHNQNKVKQFKLQQNQNTHIAELFTKKIPIQLTPLENWISRGENEHYVIKRLKNADKILTIDALKRMKTIGQKFLGKRYDFTFGWTDEKIYCSELVWKIYDRALGIQIGKLEKLGDLDLSNPIVKNVLKNRYGTHIPKKEIVISPESIYESELLKTVKSN